MQQESTALIPGNNEAIGLVRQPEEVLKDAQLAASALMKIVSSKSKKVIFNGEQYLEADDWQTIGAFHGCTADIEWSRPIIFGEGEATVSGWEARAVMRDRNGRILSHAEAMCLNDEDKWRARPKYQWCYVKKSGGHALEDPGRDEIVWEENPNPKPGGARNRPKKEKILIGEEAVPSFQLRSMAQTRAIAKVHSNIFRWVVQLAGYRGTPAEELDGSAERVDNEPQGAQAQPAQAQPKHAGSGSAAPKAAGFEQRNGSKELKSDPGVFRFGALPRAIAFTATDGSAKEMWELQLEDGRTIVTFEPSIRDAATTAFEAGAYVRMSIEESKRKKGQFRCIELAPADPPSQG